MRIVSYTCCGVVWTYIVWLWVVDGCRHYGALQGLSKERTAARLGRALVMKWRRSYVERPPLMTPEHPHYPIIYSDPRYRRVPNIPLGESLQDCQERVVEGFRDIVKDIQQCDDATEPTNSLIVAHANTLRALVMHLDDIAVDDIEGLNIPTAVPFFYDVDKKTGKVLDLPNQETLAEVDKIGVGKFRGIYIADERKKRSFLERRRAANDPFIWALHDHQVARSMLVEDEEGLGLEGLEEEAKQNTETFSSALQHDTHVTR
jgi:bisphosphoglycerate-dependent phosphoglycerate mutase family 1